MAGGRLWTTLEERELKRLLALDMKHATIGKRLNRSTSAIHFRVSKLKPEAEHIPRLHRPGELQARVRELALPGVPDSAIAGTLGVTRKTIEKTRRRLGIPAGVKRGGRLSSPEVSDISTVAKVLRLYAGVGRSDSEIGRLLGIAKTSVVHHRKKLGLPALGIGTEGLGGLDV